MEEFNKCISEMESIVKALAGKKRLSTKKYSFAKKGIKDNKTGVMLFVENAPLGVLIRLIHPKMNYASLETKLKDIGYNIKEEKKEAIIYSLEKAKNNLPDMIAIGYGGKEIDYCELKTKERKKCLAPIKSLLFYLNH